MRGRETAGEMREIILARARPEEKQRGCWEEDEAHVSGVVLVCFDHPIALCAHVHTVVESVQQVAHLSSERAVSGVCALSWFQWGWKPRP